MATRRAVVNFTNEAILISSYSSTFRAYLFGSYPTILQIHKGGQLLRSICNILVLLLDIG